jgi:hypothetical protein
VSAAEHAEVRISEKPPEFPYYVLAVGVESYAAGCSDMKVAMGVCADLDKHAHFKEVVLCPSRRIIAPVSPAVSQ